MTIEAFAPAKINLTLHVTGHRPDGYHVLDSLVAFADVGDRLRLESGDQMAINVSGPFASGVPEDTTNLVWKAANLAEWQGTIHLEKNLPHGAGIGGGSSDAAAVLRALNYKGAAVTLGADVPVCQLAGAARMQGIGDVIDPIASMPSLPCLLVNPGVHVPTPAVFSALKDKNNPSQGAFPVGSSPEDWLIWLAAQRNDLQEPAQSQVSEITDVLDELARTKDVRLVRMSGSGGTCFALYPTMKAAHFAAYEVGAAQPDWWCVATTLN